jgi:hypothetical protein
LLQGHEYRNVWELGLYLIFLDRRADYVDLLRKLIAWRKLESIAPDQPAPSRPNVESNSPPEGKYRPALYSTQVLWHADVFFVRPSLDLLAANQLDRAGALISQAADQVRILGTSIIFDQEQLQRITRILLLDVVINDIVLLNVDREFANLIVDTFKENFPDYLVSQIISVPTTALNKPYIAYVTRVNAFRRRDYIKALEQFQLAQSSSANNRLTELARFMQGRLVYWITLLRYGTEIGEADEHAINAAKTIPVESLRRSGLPVRREDVSLSVLYLEKVLRALSHANLRSDVAEYKSILEKLQ